MTLQQTQTHISDLFWNITHVIPVAIFVFITIIPSDALAWSQELSTSEQSLLFIRDPILVDEAIMGSEAFSAAPASKRPRASTVRPVIESQIKPGATVRVLAFAYSSSVSQTDSDPWTTASGSHVKAGTMAANFLPFGATVRIAGKTYTVQDRMNERYNNTYVVDLWQTSHEAAIVWGARAVEMEIITLP